MKDYFNVVGLFALTLIFLSMLGWASRPVDEMVERKVMVNSHQYIEGNNQRAATIQANITEINAMLFLNPENRDELLAKKRALLAMLKATQK